MGRVLHFNGLTSLVCGPTSLSPVCVRPKLAFISVYEQLVIIPPCAQMCPALVFTLTNTRRFYLSLEEYCQ